MTNPIDYWKFFSGDYASARDKFRHAAIEAKARISQYVLPGIPGSRGESLSVDVAHIGRPNAPRQLIAISGTHGLEGAAGSAIQVATLATLSQRALKNDVSILLIHALNPYGYSYDSRTTENNVDLNRNFVDFSQPLPENAGYDALHSSLTPAQWTSATSRPSQEALKEYGRLHGESELFDVLARGQYTHPDGLIYGGRAREWSNRTLERILSEYSGHAERFALIDWHTGIGSYGEPFFLCFNDEGGEEERQASAWWGTENIRGQRPHGLQRPNYQGLVFRGVQQFVGNRPLAGAVIEFGTRGLHMRSALRLDRWLRFRRSGQPDAERDAMLRADLIDAFVPASSVWRNAVLKHGLRITEQTIAGLAQWQ